MKKLMAGVLVAMAVLALSAVIAANAGSTQASNDRDQQVTQPEDVSRLKGNAQAEEDEDNDTEKRPFLGITILPVPPAKAEELGIDGGVLVGGVLDDGPSAGALQKGDIIVAINGEAVTSRSALAEKIEAAEPGVVLTLTVIRDGETQGVDVTLGEREIGVIESRIAKRLRRGPDLQQDLLNYVRQMRDRFVRAELVLETDDGFKTFRAVAGTASDVDVENGTFVLTPKDGSEPIEYTISEDTVVNMRRKGDLGGLNTTDKTLVVDVDGNVKLVNQGDLPLPPQMHERPDAGPRFKMHKQIRRPMPGMRGFDVPEGMRDRLGQLDGPGGLGDRLADILPPDMAERLERFRSEHDEFDIDIDVQADGWPGAMRDLVCDEEIRDNLPAHMTVRCTNLDTDNAQ